MSLAAARQPMNEGQRLIKILPGGYYAADEDLVLATVLGSCVAACLYDAEAGVGGMNHFMLPDGTTDGSGSARYGVHAMELLINALLSLGASRARLQAKVFGGGAVLRQLTTMDVGARNAEFVQRFLLTERIPIVGADLRDLHPRKVYFHPVTGRAFIKHLPLAEKTELVREERNYLTRLVKTPVSSGTVELF